MTSFLPLVRWFRYLTLYNGDGINKRSSGYVKIIYSNEDLVEEASIEPTIIYVEFGGYDVADMNRHHTIGPFKSEEEAFGKTKEFLESQTIKVNELLKEDQLPLLDIKWEDLVNGVLDPPVDTIEHIPTKSVEDE